MAAVSKGFSRFLTSPRKFAHILDWKKRSGNILSLNISKSAIDIVVASHPSRHEPAQPLPSIPVRMATSKNRKILQQGVVEELGKIVQDWRVCGLLVSWPLEKEGWCGVHCGRVLHTLDRLAIQSTRVVNEKRPVCLWDVEHRVLHEDEWGRSKVYSTTTDKAVYVASEKRHRDDGMGALNVWNDFCQTHWPELCEHHDEFISDSSYAVDSGNAKIALSWLVRSRQLLNSAAAM